MNRIVIHIAFISAAWLWLGWATDVRAETPPTYEIIAADGRLSPERIEVPSGKRIKLAIKNAGKGPIEFENLDMRIEKVLAPGASSFVVTPPLRPGTYVFVDEFHEKTAKMELIAK